MNKAVIDTNIYSHFKRNDRRIIQRLRFLETIFVDVTVIAELYSGFKLGNRESLNVKELHQFLDSPRAHILKHDLATTHFYAKIFSDLKNLGKPIPTNDLWIASVCMQNGLPLFTLDDHFSSIPGLIILNP